MTLRMSGGWMCGCVDVVDVCMYPKQLALLEFRWESRGKEETNFSGWRAACFFRMIKRKGMA